MGHTLRTIPTDDFVYMLKRLRRELNYDAAALALYRSLSRVVGHSGPKSIRRAYKLWDNGRRTNDQERKTNLLLLIVSFPPRKITFQPLNITSDVVKGKFRLRQISYR